LYIHFFIDKKSYNIDIKNNKTFVSTKKNINKNKKKNLLYKLNSKQPLIDFLFNLGIDIPHYCYHQTLSIAGNCRMCLVELKGSIKPLVSCSMSAKGTLVPNTQVYTNSPLVKKARENILEFLLLNHPLDCPICDQGGECDLQDQSLFFGFTKKRFYSLKRIVTDKNIGPVIKTVMTRCIHCTRCVRFATEIAGVEDLGIFGRGLNSEIGTYVNKTFQSELSGNVIDLCPVGALTSKSHPFVGRKWELKIINSIDCFDSFGSNIQLLIKNNNIVRVMPNFNFFNKINSWITDKARFSFEGMFSAEREFQTIYFTGNRKKVNGNSWNFVFNELSYFIYFFDHLNKHAAKIYSFIVVFSSHVSLEVISLLHILSKKYYFFLIRKNTKNGQILNDMEANFQLNVTLYQNILSITKYCILVGVNTRYEGSSLNLKLRQRFKKGNFQIFSLGSLTDFTYPITYIGSTFKSFKLLVEGNSIYCQDLNMLYYFSFLVICNSELYSRNDNKATFELFSILKHQTTNFVTKYWNNKINVLNSTINDVGLNVLNKFFVISSEDFKKSNGIYFINTSVISPAIQQLLELKLLEYFYMVENVRQIFIEQNNIPFGFSYYKYYKNGSYLFLPNNVFFETSNTYINTEGLIKKTLKSVSPVKNTKSDWQILRKLLSYSNTVHVGNVKRQKKKIQFDCRSLFNFKSYISFLYYSSENLTSLSFYIGVKNTSFDFKQIKFKSSVAKMYNTTFKRWIDDFYLGFYNTYCNYSYTMVECSAAFRHALTNYSSHL
jgi:NADH-quinone oxidoreductase chain G